MLFGAAYYPEHWPEERWKKDAGMMKEAGFNVVRMAEFAWHTLQPTENEFDFGWLDRAVDIMGKHGIKSILGTPTAAPPKWLADRCPGIHMVDDRGHVRGFGSRRYYCFNNKQYHEHTKTIVSKMAEHYFGNENITGWQIDNELGGMNTTRCYCENCRKEFIIWLKERYETIQGLNEQWGTIFSGQCFNSWDEVILPRLTAMGGHNPSLLLDFDRFSSDCAIRYLQLQADILREKAPGQMITTNTITFFNDIDYYRMFENLDLVSVDIYPNISEEETISPMMPALSHDITRGIKNRNYIVSEHQSGAPMGHVLHRGPKARGHEEMDVPVACARSGCDNLFQMAHIAFWHRRILAWDIKPRRASQQSL